MTPGDGTVRVAMVVGRRFPGAGGAERQLEAVIPELARLGVEVHVVARRHPGRARDERLGGAHVHRAGGFGPKPVASLSYLAGAVHELRSIQPDVVHAHGLLVQSTIGLVARRLLGTPLVVTHHGGGQEGEVARLLRRPFGGRRLEGLRRHATFVVISRHIADELAAAGIDRSQQRFVPNGVDVLRLRPAEPPEQQAVRDALGFGAGPIVAYTGRLVAGKGLPELLHAWPAVRATYPAAELVLVGKGPEEDALRRVAGDGVRFAGWVDDVDRYLAAADAFVLPSYGEGLPTALLEAMAAGLACVATDIGGCRDLVVDGSTGRLVGPGDVAGLADALVEVLDPPVRSRLGAAARDVVVQRYSLAATADHLAQLYRALAVGAVAPRATLVA